MGVLLVALLSGALSGLAVGLAFGSVAGVFPGLVVFGVVYFLLARRVAKKLEDAMGAVYKEVQRGQVEAAVRMLETLKNKVGKMQFFAGASIDGQIGSLYFMRKDFDRARPFLEKSFVRLWHTQVMLAVLLAKKKEFAEVDRVLERAAKYSPKQGLLWSTWAWLHWKAGHRDVAIQLLARGKAALDGKDEVLNENLLALQNNKKMKMKRYGDMWYQFHLEEHPRVLQAQRGGHVRFARR